MNSLVGKVLTAAGLTGSDKPINSLVPRSAITPDRILQDFTKGGEVENPDVWASYNSVMRRPRTFEESIRLWDEMANWDMLAAALVEIAEEACQTDATCPSVLWYSCADKHVEEELNDMLQAVNCEDLIMSQVWHTAAYGNNFEKLEYEIGEGVLGMTSAHPLDVRRYWLTKNRRCVGYRWSGHKPDKSPAFEIQGHKFDRTGLAFTAAGKSVEELYYPWDFFHIRRMYRNRMSEHGEPLFEEAQGIYKKLRMALDQMVVHRAQVQPDRFVVNIDVKDQIPADQLKTVQRWKQSLRRKIAFGQGNSVSGQVDEFKSYYDAMALDTILWVAKPRDFAHTIEKVPGTSSIPDVYDIELMINLFFSIIGMPKSWIGLGGDSGGSGPVSGKALLAQDIRFLRKIKSIRRPVLVGYTWLAYFHCLLKGYDVSKLDIECKMSPVGSLEDQMKIELLKTQAEVLDMLADIMPKYGLPKEAWIDVVFKEYLHLPEEVINTFLTSLPAEAQPQDESQHKPSPKQKLLVEELARRFGPDKWQLTKDIHSILDGHTPKDTTYKRYKNVDQILRPPKIMESDAIVSGYGQIDPTQDFNTTSDKKDGKSVTEQFSESVRNLVGIHMKSRPGL